MLCSYAALAADEGVDPERVLKKTYRAKPFVERFMATAAADGLGVELVRHSFLTGRCRSMLVRWPTEWKRAIARELLASCTVPRVVVRTLELWTRRKQISAHAARRAEVSAALPVDLNPVTRDIVAYHNTQGTNRGPRLAERVEAVRVAAAALPEGQKREYALRTASELAAQPQQVLGASENSPRPRPDGVTLLALPKDLRPLLGLNEFDLVSAHPASAARWWGCEVLAGVLRGGGDPYKIIAADLGLSGARGRKAVKQAIIDLVYGARRGPSEFRLRSGKQVSTSGVEAELTVDLWAMRTRERRSGQWKSDLARATAEDRAAAARFFAHPLVAELVQCRDAFAARLRAGECFLSAVGEVVCLRKRATAKQVRNAMHRLLAGDEVALVGALYAVARRYPDALTIQANLYDGVLVDFHRRDEARNQQIVRLLTRAVEEKALELGVCTRLEHKEPAQAETQTRAQAAAPGPAAAAGRQAAAGAAPALPPPPAPAAPVPAPERAPMAASLSAPAEAFLRDLRIRRGARREAQGGGIHRDDLTLRVAHR